MKKEEIAEILGDGTQIKENQNRNAFEITLLGNEIDVLVTVPYEVHEIFYEAKDKQGNELLKGWRDHYGETELEDYKESLLEIAQLIISPEFRLTNNGKTLEAKNDNWFYFFGYYSS